MKVDERRTSVEGRERASKLDELTKELMASKTEVIVNRFIRNELSLYFSRARLEILI